MSLWLISTRRRRAAPAVQGLAMSRGPTGSHWGPDCDPETGEWGSKTNQFAEAADFANHVGINIKPNYQLGSSATALARLGELGIKHVRLGLYNPTNHDNWNFHDETQRWHERALAAGVDSWGIYGAGVEARELANRGDVIPTYSADLEATWFRSLDGPPGLIGTPQNWTYGPWVGEEKYETGWFRDTGWEAVGALQGPNEPDLGRTHYPEGVGGIREQLRNMKNYKESKSSEVIMDGADYVNFETGRMEDGPAFAPQTPMIGFHMIFSWGQMGDYTNRQDIDFGSPHWYYGGHDIIYERFWPTTWGVAPPGTNHWYYDQWPYNGRLAPGGYWSRTIPLVCTETGYILWAAQDPGVLGPQRYVVPDQAGEMLIRTLVGNYSGGSKRTYLYKLTHEYGDGGNPGIPAMGLCRTDYTRTEPFYAIKNLMTLVGWGQQGSAGVAPITVPHSWAGPGADNLMDEGSGSSNTIQDRLFKIVLRRSDNEYLIILSRIRNIWARWLQQRKTVADPLNVTLTLPASNTWTCGVAEPAKNPLLDATDGQTYANPNLGTTYAAPGVAGNGFTQSGNTLTVRMAGLTRVVRIVRDTPLPPPPQTGLTPAVVAP